MIGVNKFSKMIGADHSDVSRQISAGLIPAAISGANKRGPGTKSISIEYADKIATAVRCGIPWRVAVSIAPHLRQFDGGLIVFAPPSQ